MAFEFPAFVAGWLYPAEGETLQRLAIGKTVVEIGSFKGLSTIVMARVARTVVAIDPFDQCEVTNRRDTFPVFRENIREHGVEGKVVPIVATSGQVCPLLQRGAFDLGFIDGEHTYQAVCADISYMAPLIKPGGVLTFHDYGHPEFPGIAQAVDEWRKHRRFELVNTLAVVYL